MLTLFLESPTLANTLSLELTDPEKIAELKENPIRIKEGVDYKCVL